MTLMGQTFFLAECELYKIIYSCTLGPCLRQSPPFSHHEKTASLQEREKADHSECFGNLQIREALWGVIHSIDTSSGKGISADWRIHRSLLRLKSRPCRKGSAAKTRSDIEFERCVIRQMISDMILLCPQL